MLPLRQRRRLVDPRRLLDGHEFGRENSAESMTRTAVLTYLFRWLRAAIAYVSIASHTQVQRRTFATSSISCHSCDVGHFPYMCVLWPNGCPWTIFNFRCLLWHHQGKICQG